MPGLVVEDEKGEQEYESSGSVSPVVHEQPECRKHPQISNETPQIGFTESTDEKLQENAHHQRLRNLSFQHYLGESTNDEQMIP